MPQGPRCGEGAEVVCAAAAGQGRRGGCMAQRGLQDGHVAEGGPGG